VKHLILIVQFIWQSGWVLLIHSLMNYSDKTYSKPRKISIDIVLKAIMTSKCVRICTNLVLPGGRLTDSAN